MNTRTRWMDNIKRHGDTSQTNGCRIFQTERADNRIFHLRVIGSASMRLALE